MNPYFAANQKLWDTWTPAHLESDMYDMKAFLDGKTSLKEIELNALGDVTGQSILHLQCHFGQDTLSLARMGAKTTGIDLSPVAINKAKELNQYLGLDATFVQCNVMDTAQTLQMQYDQVFTSYGTIVWLDNLNKWAANIAQSLKPGGTFYMVEFHPALHMYEWTNHQITYPYFNTGHPFEETAEGSYASNIPPQQIEYFWVHSLSEVITSLLQQDLKLVDFQEYDYSPYNCFSNMKEVEPGKYVYYPPNTTNEQNRLPHLFSLKMVKGG